MHPGPFSKSKFNLKSDRVNLVAPASHIECLLREIQYNLGPKRLTRLGNSNTADREVTLHVIERNVLLSTVRLKAMSDKE